MLFDIVLIGSIIVIMSLFAVEFGKDLKNGNYGLALIDALIVLVWFVALVVSIIPLCIGG